MIKKQRLQGLDINSGIADSSYNDQQSLSISIFAVRQDKSYVALSVFDSFAIREQNDRADHATWYKLNLIH